jgi:hypothetical protein
LHIRDEAFKALGDTNLADLEVQGGAPEFTVDLVKDNTPAEDDRIARRIEGTITAPCFLTNGCAPGGKFVFDEDGLPTRQGSITFKYFCGIPRSALDPAAAAKARPALYGYGHGLFCATAWAGFASEDVPHIAGTVIPDFSNFDTVADRMQQGFSSHPAFQTGGRSLIDTTRQFFDGNSQAGSWGRRADRAGPGLRPRSAGRAGHEQLDPASAQRRLRPLRLADQSRLHEGDRASAHVRGGSAALGSWPTSPPRSWPGPSARAYDSRHWRPGVLEPVVRHLQHRLLPLRRVGRRVVGRGHAGVAARERVQPSG